jgi:hypothetical protein
MDYGDINCVGRLNVQKVTSLPTEYRVAKDRGRLIQVQGAPDRLYLGVGTSDNLSTASAGAEWRLVRVGDITTNDISGFQTDVESIVTNQLEVISVDSITNYTAGPIPLDTSDFKTIKTIDLSNSLWNLPNNTHDYIFTFSCIVWSYGDGRQIYMKIETDNGKNLTYYDLGGHSTDKSFLQIDTGSNQEHLHHTLHFKKILRSTNPRQIYIRMYSSANNGSDRLWDSTVELKPIPRDNVTGYYSLD